MKKCAVAFLSAVMLQMASSLAHAVNDGIPPVRPAEPGPLLLDRAPSKLPATPSAAAPKGGETIGGVDKSTLKQMEQFQREKAILAIAGKEASGGASTQMKLPGLPPIDSGVSGKGPVKPTAPPQAYYDPIDEFKVQSILIYGGVPLIEVRRGDAVQEVRVGEKIRNWTVMKVTPTEVWVTRLASVVRKVKVNGREKPEIVEMPITRMLAPAEHTVLRVGGPEADKFSATASSPAASVLALPAIPSDSTSIKPVKITK